MGKHGPKSNHPSGVGYTTSKGYHRLTVWDGERGRAVMAHVLEWERHNGPIPSGHQVHHINGDKQDNRIENLQLLDSLTHKRLHSGCELRDGEWWKPCRTCGKFKRADTDFYKRKDGISAACRACSIERSIRDKQRRRSLRLHSKGE